MQIHLPSHVALALGVNECDEMDTVVHGVNLLDRKVGPLISDGAKECFNGLLQRLPVLTAVEVGDAVVEIGNWHFRTFECDGIESARVVEVPVSTTPNVSLTTSAEAVLVQAWLATDKLTDANYQLRSNIVVFEWLPNVSDAIKVVIRAICGIKLPGSSTPTARTWAAAGSVAIRGTSRLLRHKDSELLRRLFCESATELIPRWRFLSLYRIIEHGYLENVFDDLSSRFFSEPKEALESASNALRSEVEQFVRLVEGHGLKFYFEEISRINDDLIVAQNHFAVLVDREAKRKNTYQENFKRGVAICYQIRCSIVHAGSHSVVFDKSPGGDAALLAHLPELEKAVAQFLGVQTT